MSMLINYYLCTCLLSFNFIPLRVSEQTYLLPAPTQSRFYLGLDAWPHFTNSLRWLLHVPTCDHTHMGEENPVTREVREDGGSGITAAYW